jgi:DNA (cytosine-5)-methyltransferase 1
LGDYSYEFPTPIKLERTLKDVREPVVDGKYYLSDKKLQTIHSWNSLERPLEKVYGKNSIARTLTTRSGAECGSLTTYSEQFEETTNVVHMLGNTQSLGIRKLTPKEHWRLMGFDDIDVENAAKVCSNSQLYKQAGNSIVVDVLMAIFRELFVPKKTRSQWLDDLLN